MVQIKHRGDLKENGRYGFIEICGLVEVGVALL